MPENVKVTLYDDNDVKVEEKSFTNPDEASKWAGDYLAAMGFDEEFPLSGSIRFVPEGDSNG